MNKIKITFLSLLVFYFILHFVGPSVFYLIFGYGPIYQDKIFDLESMKLGFNLNLFSLLLSSVLIWFTPDFFKTKANPSFKKSYIFLSLSIFFVVGVFLTNVDFRNALLQSNARSDWWVLGEMFFNLEFYIIFSMVYSVNFISEINIFYVLLKIVAGIRSAPLVLLHYLICSYPSSLFKRYVKRYLIYMFFAIAVSMFGFNWATSLRENDANLKRAPLQQLKASTKINSWHIYKIVGRFSYLETTMLPIYYKKINDQNKINIFIEKYGFISQMKILINNFVPGDIFKFDVYPNQYYRAAFLNLPVEKVKEVYTSINITLPVYLYMFLGTVGACVATAILLWIYYIVVSFTFQINYLLGTAFLISLYPNFLTFFDFVMFGKAIYVSIISAGLFIVLGNFELKLFSLLGKVNEESPLD